MKPSCGLKILQQICRGARLTLWRAQACEKTGGTKSGDFCGLYVRLPVSPLNQSRKPRRRNFMPTPLNILIVEDSPSDAELALAELHRAGFDPKWKRVETEADFLAEIKKSPDIILSDYAMPEFSGLRAAELLRTSGLDIPFILISGTVGEEAAVAAMQLGATDYLLKDRLARLGSAVKRALHETQERIERKQVEAALNNERDLWRMLLDTSPDYIYFKDAQSRFIKAGKAQARQFGVESPDEMVGKTDFDFFKTAHARPAFEDEQEIIRTGQPIIGKEEREVWNDGHVTWASSTKLPMRDDAGKIIGIMGISRDITERKRTEEALRESEALYYSLVDQMSAGVFRKDAEGRYEFVNSWFRQVKGITPEAILGKTPRELARAELSGQHPDDSANAWKTKLAAQGEDHHQLIMRTGEPVEVEEEHPGPD